MREFVIFYSWQSDTPRNVGNDFIRKALEAAIAALNDAGLGVRIRLDVGTEGVPGTPPVTDTILEKIETCDLFVGDVTLVGEVAGADGANAKRIPNPNVMAEFGFAMRAIGLRRILLVMNTAFGNFKDLPFDLGHLRKPIDFEGAPDIKDGPRRAAREALAGELIQYIKTAITAALATATPDRAMHDRAQTRLGELLTLAPLGGAPALVNFPRAMLHIVPLAASTPGITLGRVANARPLLLPRDGADHEAGADHAEWWAHAPTRMLRLNTNPVAPWCARLFADGAIEVAWNVGKREDDDPEILADGCAIEQRTVAWTGRLLQALRLIGFEHGAIAQLSLLGLDDVVLTGKTSITRKFRVQNLGLPAVALAPQPDDIAIAFQPAFEKMWLAAGLEQGSPCG